MRCCVYRELFKRMQYSRQNTFMVLATGQAKVTKRRGQERTGQERTGQDRTGQDRTGQDKMG
jgi:hypothetical protein